MWSRNNTNLKNVTIIHLLLFLYNSIMSQNAKIKMSFK